MAFLWVRVGRMPRRCAATIKKLEDAKQELYIYVYLSLTAVCVQIINLSRILLKDRCAHVTSSVEVERCQTYSY